MSECVVRMEMPQNCYNCDLRYECNAFYAPGKPKPFMRGCRIVCQLPEGHGDLIDRDELWEDSYPDDEYDAYVVYADDVCKARAVVPADKAERSET